VRDVTLAAHEHPDILYESAFQDLGSRGESDPGGLDTFRILFQLAKLPPADQGLTDLKFSRLAVDNEKMRKDLSLFLTQSDQLTGRFRYSLDVLDRERVVRMRHRFLRLLSEIVVDPDRPLTELVAADPL
jgi:hypothetical protein